MNCAIGLHKPDLTTPSVDHLRKITFTCVMQRTKSDLMQMHRGATASTYVSEERPIIPNRVSLMLPLLLSQMLISGVAPATEFLKGSGIAIGEDGFIKVDREFRTNIPDIYAAGDITKFSLELFAEEEAHVEHWQTGQKQGYSLISKPTNLLIRIRKHKDPRLF